MRLRVAAVGHNRQVTCCTYNYDCNECTYIFEGKCQPTFPAGKQSRGLATRYVSYRLRLFRVNPRWIYIE
jgi:hypothetical protein